MEKSEMDLEKLDSKMDVDAKAKRVAVKTKSSGFRLTERDVELLGLLLDQKFASLEQIYFRFFRPHGVTKRLRRRGAPTAKVSFVFGTELSESSGAKQLFAWRLILAQLVLAIVAFLSLPTISWAAVEAVSYDFLETQVDVSKLKNSQLMALGSTLPGKLYRVNGGVSCIVTAFSVTKVRNSSGWFSTSSTIETGLPLEAIVHRKQIVDRILALQAEKPELFAATKDAQQNVDLAKLSGVEDAEIAQLAQSAIAALNAFCN